MNISPNTDIYNLDPAATEWPGSNNGTNTIPYIVR